MKKLLGAVLLIGIIFMIYKLVEFSFFSTEVQTVRIGNLENAVKMTGFLVKNERLLTAEAVGILDAFFSEGEKVAVGSTVASVITGGGDPDSETKLLRVNERLSGIQQSQGSMFKDDVIRIDSEIDRKLREISFVNNSIQKERINVLSAEIRSLLDKKLAITGGNEAAQGLIAQLTNEKIELEQKIGAGRFNIVSPYTGVFSSVIDGFEEILNLDNAKTIGVAEYEDLERRLESEHSPPVGGPVCKIIENFQWGLLIKAPQSVSNAYKPDDYVKLRFAELSNELVSARVVSLSTPSDQYQIMYCLLDRYVENVVLQRHTSVELIQSSASGLKISKSALTVIDDVEGVFVKTSLGPSFKPVSVLVKDDKDIIIKDEGIVLYDQVYTKGKPTDR